VCVCDSKQVAAVLVARRRTASGIAAGWTGWAKVQWVPEFQAKNLSPGQTFKSNDNSEHTRGLLSLASLRGRLIEYQLRLG